MRSLLFSMASTVFPEGACGNSCRADLPPVSVVVHMRQRGSSAREATGWPLRRLKQSRPPLADGAHRSVGGNWAPNQRCSPRSIRLDPGVRRGDEEERKNRPRRTRRHSGERRNPGFRQSGGGGEGTPPKRADAPSQMPGWSCVFLASKVCSSAVRPAAVVATHPISLSAKDLEKELEFRSSPWERLPSCDSAKPMIGLRQMSRPGDRSHKRYGRRSRLGGLGSAPLGCGLCLWVWEGRGA